jgi:hypothetical protein
METTDTLRFKVSTKAHCERLDRSAVAGSFDQHNGTRADTGSIWF